MRHPTCPVKDRRDMRDNSHFVLRGFRLFYHDTLVRLSLSDKACFTEACRIMLDIRLTQFQRDESLNPIHR